MSTVYRNLFAMGTRFDLVIPGIDEDYGDFLFSQISREVRRLDEFLSNFNDYSTLSRLNKTAWEKPYFAGDEMFDLISELKQLHSLTLGFFDVSLGIFKHSIHNKTEEKASFKSRMEHISLNQDSKTVHFERPDLIIDSGGFGKGYALENVKKILVSHNIHQAFISFGESSVFVLGEHPFGDSWKVSIPDIYSSENAYIVHLRDNALSVSGNTPQNSAKYPEGHIINAETGLTEKKMGIVCVTGRSAFLCEILSTALFAAGGERQKGILRNFPGYKAVTIEYTEDKKPVIQEIEYNEHE